MLSRRRMSAALLAALVAGPVVGPVVGGGGGASGEPVLRLGYFPNITHAAALVGVRDGSFARELGATTIVVVATRE